MFTGSCFDSKLCAGEGDGNEHDQPKQGPSGRHGRRPANAGRPATQSQSAQGLPGEDPGAGPCQAAVDQPCVGPSFHSGESLADAVNV